jgi:hypothetical protein
MLRFAVAAAVIVGMWLAAAPAVAQPKTLEIRLRRAASRP